MKNKFKKVFCLLAMPLLLSTAAVSFNNNNVDNIKTSLVKRAGNTSPQISIQGNKFTVDNTAYDYSSTNATAVRIDAKSVIEITLESKAANFSFTNYAINVKAYAYTEDPNSEGSYIKGDDISSNKPFSEKSDRLSDSVIKYTLTINRKSIFGIEFTSEGNDTYQSFTSSSFIFVGSRTQTGISISVDDIEQANQVDGGRFDITFSSSAGQTELYKFVAIFDADAKVSTGSEFFSLEEINGDEEKIKIEPSGLLSVSTSNISCKLVYTKHGDNDFDELIYRIDINISEKIDTPEAIFESNGQNNYNNTLYNLVPFASYRIKYSRSNGTQLVHNFIALDGENVLSDDENIDYLYATSKNKGYYVVDSEQSWSMSDATITEITRLALKNSGSVSLIDSDPQTVSFKVLPRKELPSMYDIEMNTNGIRFDDANGILRNLKKGVEYIITYRKKDERNKLYSYIVLAQTTDKTTYDYDLAEFLPGGEGATLETIAVHGSSGTRIEDCVANSFNQTLSGVVYPHENLTLNTISPDRPNLITKISGLTANSPYLLYTASLGSSREYITITSDENGEITLDNNNSLGTSTLENSGITITAIKKAGIRSEDTITTNSKELKVNYTFIDIKSYKRTILESGKEKCEQIGQASLKSTGLLSLNDKQIKAIDTTKASIDVIDVDNLTTKEIREKVDQLTSELQNSINSYIGFWGYINSIQGWIYIGIAIALYIVLIIMICIYRSKKKKYQKYSVTVLQRFSSVVPFLSVGVFTLFDINSVGGNFFAPIIIIIEIIFIAIFFGLALSYSRKANDLKRWKKYHDEKGELITDRLSKRDLKKMQKFEKKTAKQIEKKDKKQSKNKKSAKA